MRASWQTPVQWPGAADDRPALQAGTLLKWGLLFGLLSLTVLDRFGLRAGQLYTVHPAMLALFGLVALTLLTGAAEINLRSAFHYAALASVAVAGYLVNASFGASQYVSVGSCLLLLVLYAPFMISRSPAAGAAAPWLWTTRMYIGFALFVAAAGIVQFGAQFVFRAPWLFDFTPLIPAPIRGLEVWRGVAPVGDWIKSNGFFLREPSFFSLHMALGLLCELNLSRRRWVMAILALGLVLSYSGSGLLVLGVGLLFPLGRSSLLRLGAALALLALVFVVFGDVLNLSYIVARLGEFNSERSSAHCRFIAPAVATLQGLDANPWTALLGHGPGTLEKMHSTCETTFAKVPFEYGLLGALALGLLVLGVLRRSALPVGIRAALLAAWLTQPFLLGPEWVLLTYMLCAMWRDSRESSDER